MTPFPPFQKKKKNEWINQMPNIYLVDEGIDHDGEEHGD